MGWRLLRRKADDSEMHAGRGVACRVAARNYRYESFNVPSVDELTLRDATVFGILMLTRVAGCRRRLRPQSIQRKEFEAASYAVSGRKRRLDRPETSKSNRNRSD